MIKSTAVSFPVGDVVLAGDLAIPAGAAGIVVFVHGSGSGRHSSRNKFVAAELNKAGFATLLFDLLTEKEDEVYETRFDIGLLTDRIVAVTEWLTEEGTTKDLKIGYFGASTGAAAALVAAARLGGRIAAVVSRGGRPDLADDALPEVKAPTLLIVGGADTEVIALNESAYARLSARKEMKIVPGATHLFEEPGTLEKVARLAAGWFKRHF